MFKFFQLLLFLAHPIIGLSQNVNPDPGYIFDDNVVPRIDIFLEQDSLDKILDQNNWESNHEYPAIMVYTKGTQKDTVYKVGFRLRGNTSREAAKKSFKIAVNSFTKGQKYKGLEKINLNGESNDPSIIRSKVCWNIFNAIGIPSSRSVHTRFYINGEYRGLYIHIEHIDEEFIQKRFDDNSGNLYKCLWPADFHYKGSNPLIYAEPEPWGRQAYALKTNLDEYDYSDIAHFIDVLNNYQGEEFKCEIERIFDVDAYLKVIATDILISNWDGPIVNKNNCYLYHDPKSDKLVYIPFDLDNTLGIDFFNVNWTTSDIYNWSSLSNEYRPIYERFIIDDEYKARLSFYFKDILENHFNPELLEIYLEDTKALISQYRVFDSYADEDYGWSYEDFIDSYKEGLGAHVEIGLSQYILSRYSSALDQLQLSNIKPIANIVDVDWSPNEIVFLIKALDDSQLIKATFNYSENNEDWISIPITINADGMSEYTHMVTADGYMQYYVELIDNNGQVSTSPRCKNGEINLGYKPTPGLVINEFLASNSADLLDDFGEHEDWIELYNVSDEDIDLSDLYLSDDPAKPNKWSLPNSILPPGKYKFIWADDDTEQGALHTNFKLAKNGEFLGLFDNRENNFAPIDTITFPEQEENISYARLPNGIGPFQKSQKNTPGVTNDIGTKTKEIKPETVLFPNPANTYINLVANHKIDGMEVITLEGECIIEIKHKTTIDISTLVSGIYFLKYWNNDTVWFEKFSKL